MAPAARAFSWYLAGTGSWFASSGMQTIVFPWLVTVVLHEPAARVGIAQMSLMAPSIFLMLLGGAVADRADCRRLLVRGHLVAAVPPLLLGAAIAGGGLTYGGLIVYALAVGTAGAFVMPARDAMLTRVAAGGLGRAVAVMTATQFAAQLVGIGLGGSAGAIGAPALLLLQAAVLAFGGIAALRLPAAPPMAGAAARSRLGAMRDGLRAAAGSPILVPVLIANLAVGVLYVGAFLVILPLIVRDVYGGGSAQLSLVSLGFWGGTIGSTLVQIRAGSPAAPGAGDRARPLPRGRRARGHGVAGSVPGVRGALSRLGPGGGCGHDAGADAGAGGGAGDAPRADPLALPARSDGWGAGRRPADRLSGRVHRAARRGGLSRRVHVAGAGRAAASFAPLATGRGAMRRVQRIS